MRLYRWWMRQPKMWRYGFTSGWCLAIALLMFVKLIKLLLTGWL